MARPQGEHAPAMHLPCTSSWGAQYAAAAAAAAGTIADVGPRDLCWKQKLGEIWYIVSSEQLYVLFALILY